MRALPLAVVFALGCREPVEETGDTEPVDLPADADGDGFSAEEDCDDADASVHPGAAEVCDGVDEDCNGVADDRATDAASWFADSDGDGFGDPGAALSACEAPEGHTSDGTDCDDASADVFPGAIEACDGRDQDCDGVVDDAAGDTWHVDADGDGYGDPDETTQACDGTGSLVADGSDCDDASAAIHPAAVELCNEVDDDCDAAVDESDAADASTWFADTDGDGYGDSADGTVACAAPEGYVADALDCDDTSAASFPGGDEICDGADNDCDGDTDEPDALDALTWYADVDADGYGDPAAQTLACDQPLGHVADASDCDDEDGSAWPGGVEVCDGDDEDCDGVIDEDEAIDAPTWHLDADRDGHGASGADTAACAAPDGYVDNLGDCDDTAAYVSPDAAEKCNDIDDDCDGEADEDDAVDALVWHADTDGDGFGKSGADKRACALPSGYADDTADCDDANPAVNPDATERCNGWDDDCDGSVDEPDAADAKTWYADADLDSYGDPTSSKKACAAPSGYLDDQTDCDDTDPDVYPGADDWWPDGVDSDCDGDVDQDAGRGSGADGDLVTSGKIDLSVYKSGGRSAADGALARVAAISSAKITLTGPAAGLAAGDEVLIINLQGTKSANAAVGRYAFGLVDGVSGADVTLSAPLAVTLGQSGNGDLSGQTIALIRVPNYRSVTVKAGTTLTTAPWNGTLGGVVAFRVRDALVVESGGAVTASALGFRGGATGPVANCDGDQGESYGGVGVGAKDQTPTRCATYNQYNANNLKAYLANLGAGGCSITGGGGNHSGGATAGDYWGGGPNEPPRAGQSYGVADLSRMFFGSGGGAVWNDNATPGGEGPGGSGGGILYVTADQIEAKASGAFVAVGQAATAWGSGSWTYGAGGGAGGTVWLAANELVLPSGAVDARGGSGQKAYTRDGGDGGLGRVRYEFQAINGTPFGSGATAAVNMSSEPDPGSVAAR